jgi:hypothetical protein
VPSLVLGPLLRYVGETEAVIWVETDAPCEVEVLGSRERSFHVEGHHYALVRIEGLEPGREHEYEVALDGERVWPEAGSEFPPSFIRTYPRDAPLRVAFGSCRLTIPHEPPYTLRKDEDSRGREIDALYALALRMRNEPLERWPQVLLLLGDQVYADEVSPRTREFIAARRDASEPPGEEILDFEEYTRLYREAWSEPVLRWLLSTVSTAMIFDDHDVHDDWNTSEAWVRKMRAKSWWDERIVGALMSYWIYQHVGNLAPAQHERDGLLERVRRAGDAGPLLREFAYRADRETAGAQWSYCRDLGRTRLVVIDSRAGRVLGEGRRSMFDDAEWDWIVEHATGGFDHLLIASSLPILLSPGMHHLEAWNEAVCAGAWGGAAARIGDALRQGIDLEHWAAFGESFAKLVELERSVAAGERGPAPASIVMLSGDVHHAYLHEVAFPGNSGVRSAVYQAVCSPIRNPLGSRERRAFRIGVSDEFGVAMRLLARSAGCGEPDIRWRLVGGGPWFDNQICMLEIDGRRMGLRLEKTVPDEPGHARLECVLAHRLA